MREVVVVGGGLTGLAVGHALAAAGTRVTVLERAVPGAEASSAAAGILAPRVEAHGREPLRTHLIEGLDAWEGWLDSLGVAAESVGFARCGALVTREAKPDVDAVWRDDAQALEPILGAPGAWWLPEEGVVDPRAVLPALREAAEAAGVRFVTGIPVARVEPDAAVLTDGTVLRGEVIVCAGAWTGRVEGVATTPVRPVRGQIVALEGVPLRRVVFGTGGYVVPRPATPTRVLAGATVEEAGFEKAVTAGGLHQVLGTALRIAPSLAAARVVESWAGLRPGTPDELPVLGRVDGTWVAAGHYRNGILLAPWTARVMRGAILDGAPLPEAFSPARFA